MPHIVSYTGGGLANRVRPVVAMEALCRARGWRHSVYWLPDFNCGAAYQVLFKSPAINLISDRELNELSGLQIFCNPESLQNQIDFHPDHFKSLVRRNAPVSLDYRKLLAGAFETAIVFDNQPPKMVYPSEVQDYLAVLAELTPLAPAAFKPASAPYVGAHIRATDFRERKRDYEKFLAQKISELSKNIAVQTTARDVHVATDEPVGLDIAKASLSGFHVQHDVKAYPTIGARSDTWSMNTTRSFENLRDAVDDIFMLAGADIRIGLHQSTFFLLAQEINLAHRAFAAPTGDTLEDFRTVMNRVALASGQRDALISMKDRVRYKLQRSLRLDPLSRYQRQR